MQSTWGTQYSDIGYGVAIDPTGTIFVAGKTFGDSSLFSAFVLLLAYDSSGTLKWQRTWRNGTGINEGEGIAADPSSGSLYLTGVTAYTGFDYPHGFLVKFDSSGNLIWQKNWAETIGSAVALDPSGYIYVMGLGGSVQSVSLMKFDSLGNVIWARMWGGNAGITHFGQGIAIDSSGDIYITGYTTSFGAGDRDVFLVKFSSSGSLLWQRTWGGQGSDAGAGVALDSAGNLYVAGGTGSLGTGSTYPFLLKIDPSGNLSWQKVWVGDGDSCCQGVAVDPSGNIYVEGRTNPSGGRSRVLLLRFDSSGGLIWQTTWGGSLADIGQNGVNGIAVDPAGDAVLTGQVAEPPPYTLVSPGTSTLETPSFILGTPSGTVGTPSVTVANLQGVTSTPVGTTTYAGNGDVYLTIISNSPAPPTSNPPWTIFGVDPAIFYGIVAGATVLAGISLAAVVVRRRKNMAASVRTVGLILQRG